MLVGNTFSHLGKGDKYRTFLLAAFSHGQNPLFVSDLRPVSNLRPLPSGTWPDHESRRLLQDLPLAGVQGVQGVQHQGDGVDMHSLPQKPVSDFNRQRVLTK